MIFVNRADAGRRLAGRLAGLAGRDVIVLGLPRGGVPVAAAVAERLHAPLDIIVVRKLGLPGNRELAMGAVGERGVVVVNRSVLAMADVSDAQLHAVQDEEKDNVRRRAALFRQSTPAIPVTGRTVVIVDDGMATGATAKAACQVARAMGAAQVILAVPVAAPDAVAALRAVADEVICLEMPSWLQAVGQWYHSFGEVSDDEVMALLAKAGHQKRPGKSLAEVRIDTREAELIGDLSLPPDARGLVVFVHGSGSSRHSPRNAYVARILHEAGLGTLLFDLLTEQEGADRANVFDIELLAGRLVATTRWVRRQPWSAGLPIGWFGASTGSAAALWAAGKPQANVAAVVSRGGRPDLAASRLPNVQAPTLLIVGGDDPQVLRLNEQAAALMACPHELVIVPGASHLFEEPGTLEIATTHARDWFAKHLLRPKAVVAR